MRELLYSLLRRQQTPSRVPSGAIDGDISGMESLYTCSRTATSTRASSRHHAAAGGMSHLPGVLHAQLGEATVTSRALENHWQCSSNFKLNRLPA